MKKYYKITQTAEDESSGYVLLTEDEAKIIAYALNSKNWLKEVSTGWSGGCDIDIDHPISEEEFSKI